MVFVALQDLRLFQPGNGGAHFGVSIVGLGVDALLVRELAQDFPGCGDDFFTSTVTGFNGPQGLEDGLNVAQCQAGVS